MSKKLEEEYRKLMEQEAPDLWSRIEQELPEKKKKLLGFRTAQIRILAGVAAAVAIICVAVPAVRITDGGDGKKIVVNRPQWMDDEKEIPETAQSPGETRPETAPRDEASQLTPKSSDSPTEVSFPPVSAEGETVVPEESGETEQEESPEDIEVASGENAEAGTSGEEDGQNSMLLSQASEYEDVPVSITGVRTANGEKIYTARVLEDTKEGPAKDTLLTLKGDAAVGELETGSKYSVTISISMNSVSQDASVKSTAAEEIYFIDKVK